MLILGLDSPTNTLLEGQLAVPGNSVDNKYPARTLSKRFVHLRRLPYFVCMSCYKCPFTYLVKTLHHKIQILTRRLPYSNSHDIPDRGIPIADLSIISLARPRQADKAKKALLMVAASTTGFFIP